MLRQLSYPINFVCICSPFSCAKADISLDRTTWRPPLPSAGLPGFTGTMGISDSLHPSGFLPFVRTPYLLQGNAGPPLLTCGDCESWLALWLRVLPQAVHYTWFLLPSAVVKTSAHPHTAQDSLRMVGHSLSGRGSTCYPARPLQGAPPVYNFYEKSQYIVQIVKSTIYITDDYRNSNKPEKL